MIVTINANSLVCRFESPRNYVANFGRIPCYYWRRNMSNEQWPTPDKTGQTRTGSGLVRVHPATGADARRTSPHIPGYLPDKPG